MSIELGSVTEDRDQAWMQMSVSDSQAEDKKEPGGAKFAINASWVVNWLLLIAKIAGFIFSKSKSVLASLVDSVVDLLSQLVLTYAEKYITQHSPDYPVGRSRLEALSVIACSFIMSMASVEGLFLFLNNFPLIFLLLLFLLFIDNYYMLLY